MLRNFRRENQGSDCNDFVITGASEDDTHIRHALLPSLLPSANDGDDSPAPSEGEVTPKESAGCVNDGVLLLGFKKRDDTPIPPSRSKLSYLAQKEARGEAREERPSNDSVISAVLG